jgi:hypothetical protein
MTAIIYGAFNSSINICTSWRRMVGWKMNGKLKIIWKETAACVLFNFFLGLLFDPEDEDRSFFQNANVLLDYKALHPKN